MTTQLTRQLNTTNRPRVEHLDVPKGMSIKAGVDLLMYNKFILVNRRFLIGDDGIVWIPTAAIIAEWVGRFVIYEFT